ncbi:hypothetical protein LXL04_003342 [Taraxacum kok-saghyz]
MLYQMAYKKITKRFPLNNASRIIADCMSIMTTLTGFYKSVLQYSKALCVFIKRIVVKLDVKAIVFAYNMSNTHTRIHTSNHT